MPIKRTFPLSRACPDDAHVVDREIENFRGALKPPRSHCGSRSGSPPLIPCQCVLLSKKEIPESARGRATAARNRHVICYAITPYPSPDAADRRHDCGCGRRHDHRPPPRGSERDGAGSLTTTISTTAAMKNECCVATSAPDRRK
jgi:hypothetical protein